MKRGTKLLGYGVFCGVYWGKATKDWQFERVCGISPTKQEADSKMKLIHHCLSRGIRRIYTTTKLNIASHSSPHFVLASHANR